MNAPINMPSPPLTSEEFGRRYAGAYVEAVNGQVREMSMPSLKHGKICNLIAYLITDHVMKHDLGHVMTNDSFVRIKEDPLEVRGPDICFYSYERLPRGPVPEGVLPISPDLVVEVKSPSDTWSEVFAKVAEYLKVKVRAVVVIDPARMTASLYGEDLSQDIFKADEELTIPDVLPGFAVAVRRLFDG